MMQKSILRSFQLGDLMSNLLHCFQYCRWSRKIPVDDQIRFTNFIFKASVTYPEDKKLQFVKDLLNLKHVPIVAAKNANEVHESFNTKLLDFIRNHRLGTSVCDILHEVCITVCVFYICGTTRKIMYNILMCSFCIHDTLLAGTDTYIKTRFLNEGFQLWNYVIIL